jgi:hypothetical protein
MEEISIGICSGLLNSTSTPMSSGIITMYNTANQHSWLWNRCVGEHVTVHSTNRIRTFPSLLTNIGHCPTWLHKGNTQGSPPATQILKSLTCGKDFEGASIHVCKVTVTAGNSPSSTGPHISSGAAACTQEGAHCFQWLPAYQSAKKCSVEGIASKQTNQHGMLSTWS